MLTEQYTDFRIAPICESTQEENLKSGMTTLKMGVSEILNTKENKFKIINGSLPFIIPEGDSPMAEYISARLSSVLRRENVLINRYLMDYDYEGHVEYTERKIGIGIKFGVTGIRRARTLAHEASHIFAGHERYSLHKEAVADGSAFLVLRYFGIDISQASFPYIANDIKTETALRLYLPVMRETAGRIIGRIS